MRLLASVCGVKVIIPPHPSAAVVVGAAMLGKAASELSALRGGRPIITQAEAEKAAHESPEMLWDIMVEMTQAGKTIEPSASPEEQKLLDVKYKIFVSLFCHRLKNIQADLRSTRQRESIEIQRRWRDMVNEVL